MNAIYKCRLCGEKFTPFGMSDIDEDAAKSILILACISDSSRDFYKANSAIPAPAFDPTLPMPHYSYETNHMGLGDFLGFEK